MSTTKKKKVFEPIIHIHAKCGYFEIMEQVAENKSINRLVEIRDAFQKRPPRFVSDKLSVKTIKVNPTLI